MNKSFLILFCSFLLFVGIANGQTPSGVDTSSDDGQADNTPPTPTRENSTPAVVEFDFMRLEAPFNKALPFDQSFAVKIKNIPNKYKKLVVQVRELKNVKKIVKQIRKEKRDSALQRNQNDELLRLRQLERVIHNEEIFAKLPPGFYYTINDIEDGTAEFVQIGFLEPNTDYIFSISPVGSQPLSKKEKKELINYLKAEQITAPIINRIIQEVALNKEGLKSLNFLLPLLDDFNNLFATAVQRNDPKYIFSPLGNKNIRSSEVIVLTQMGELTTGLINLVNEIQGLYKIVQDKTGFYPKSNMEEILRTTDWLNFEKGSKEYNEILEQLANREKIAETDSDEFRFQRKIDALIEKLEPIKVLAEEYVTYLVAENTNRQLLLGGTYYRESSANANTYLSFDFGLGINTALERQFTYGGINVYLRPINRSIPLRHYDPPQSFWVKFSLLAGMTTASIEDIGDRKGFFGNSAGVFGAGYRLLPWLKVNAAAMIYSDIAPNPLVSKQYLTADPFFSISIDANLKDIFTGIIKSN